MPMVMAVIVMMAVVMVMAVIVMMAVVMVMMVRMRPMVVVVRLAQVNDLAFCSVGEPGRGRDRSNHR